MSLEYVERKKIESTFYLNCFRATVQFSGVLVILNICLAVIATYYLMNPKATQWIATTTDGRLINI